jgi:hypothetical protein
MSDDLHRDGCATRIYSPPDPCDCDGPTALADLRERLAAAIERKSHEARTEYERGLFRYGSAIEPGSRDPWAEGAIDAYLDAARIVRERP